LSTFVSVGNGTQPFTRLLDAVERLAPTLPAPVVVQHGSTPFHPIVCEARPFVDMAEFERRIAEAKLVILHAGAGSLIHAIRAGRIPVVMPRRRRYDEVVDDHQVELASELERAGKIVVAMEPSELEAAIARALAEQARPRAPDTPSTMLQLVASTLEGYAANLRRP